MRSCPRPAVIAVEGRIEPPQFGEVPRIHGPPARFEVVDQLHHPDVERQVSPTGTPGRDDLTELIVDLRAAAPDGQVPPDAALLFEGPAVALRHRREAPPDPGPIPRPAEANHV